MARRKLYDLGRSAEETDWRDAAKYYDRSPEGFEDLEQRRPYARARVAEHLEGCADCRACYAEYVDLLAALPAALAAVSPHRLPHALKDELLQRLTGAELDFSALLD